METTTADVLVGAGPAETYSAVLGLTARLWAVTGEDVVDARPGERLVHGVRLDGETSCWLTWELTPDAAGGTHVRLTHDEVDLRTAPAPDLDAVLALVREAVVVDIS